MRFRKPSVLASIAAAVALAASAHADVDTDFADQLHGFGIYGQKDYNAWLAKITCNRLGSGGDATAEKSAVFLSHNLPRATTPVQTWQLLAVVISTYCPDLMPTLTSVAEPTR